MGRHVIRAKGGLQIPVLTADPVSPAVGSIWYNVTDNTFKSETDTGTAEISTGSAFEDIVFNDDNPTTTFLTYPKTFRAAVLKYYIERNTSVQAGQFLLANNDTDVSLSNEFAALGDLGVTITADISGSDVRVRYSTTSTGFPATIKYSLTRW